MYKKSTSFLIVFLFILQSFAQTHWNPVNIDNSNGLNKIVSFNASKIIAIGNNGYIVESSNAGDNWNVINSPTSENLLDVFIESNSVFWIAASNGKLYKTSNSGNNWATFNLSSNAINAIDFKGDKGIAVGNNGSVFKSTDKGENWTDLGVQSIYNLNNVLHINDTLIIALGANGIILKNIRDQEEWLTIESNTSESLNALEYNFLKNQIVIAGNKGVNIRLNPINFSVSNSTNGNEWFRDIHCSTNQICYWVGFNQMISLEEPTRQRTINITQEENVTSITFVNLSRGFLTTTSGKIYETNTSGFLLSSVGVETPEISIYPNPVVNFLHIQTYLNDFRVKVYDLSGKLVLIEQNQKIIDFSGMQANTYFIEVISEKSVFRTKLIKL
ncbi:MAG: hypothetical protein RLZZ414_1871 [Bacteroidota bacterium]|jgi:photosystem II stability/assembly factor-like uncharacterized protein